MLGILPLVHHPVCQWRADASSCVPLECCRMWLITYTAGFSVQEAPISTTLAACAHTCNRCLIAYIVEYSVLKLNLQPHSNLYNRMAVQTILRGSWG